MKELIKKDPEMQKPKLCKIKDKPKSYAKRVMVKKTGLEPI